ncbi:MAG: right-handed parallel beta-helix repeat-containing protein [Nitrososphaerales archaeon]
MKNRLFVISLLAVFAVGISGVAVSGYFGSTTVSLIGLIALPAHGYTCSVTVTAGGSIQTAIDNASPGATICVAPGTYNSSQTITINQGLTLLGPNAGVSANGGARVAEAVIGAAAIPAANAIRISTTAEVTIDGFTFNGTSNPVDSYQTGSNIVIQNNIFKNTIAGSEIFFGAPATLTFTNNSLTNFTPGGSNSDELLVAGNWNGTAGTSVMIQNNVFGTSQEDAMNLDSMSGVISGNTFSNMPYYGILLANNMGSLTVTNNVFSNITNPYPNISSTWGADIRFYTPTGNGPVAITDNVFSNSYVGIGIRPSDSIASMNVQISGNSFINNTADIRNEGHGAINVTDNYWGSALAPTVATNIDGTGYSIDGSGASLATYSPWYINSATTILSTFILLSPSAGALGSSVTVNGSGFTAYSIITMKYDATTPITSPSIITASSSGSFLATFIVPTSAGGSQTVVATDTNGNSASTSFTVQDTTTTVTSTTTETSTITSPSTTTVTSTITSLTTITVTAAQTNTTVTSQTTTTVNSTQTSTTTVTLTVTAPHTTTTLTETVTSPTTTTLTAAQTTTTVTSTQTTPTTTQTVTTTETSTFTSPSTTTLSQTVTASGTTVTSTSISPTTVTVTTTSSSTSTTTTSITSPPGVIVAYVALALVFGVIGSFLLLAFVKGRRHSVQKIDA